MKRALTQSSSLAAVLIAVFYLAGCQNSDVDIIPGDKVEISSYFAEWQPIEDQYIVVYKKSAIDPVVNARVFPDFGERKVKMTEISREILRENQLPDRDLTQIYASAIKGFALKMKKAEKDILLKDERVAYIEQDQYIPLERPPWAGGGGDDGSTGQETPWGITRVNGGVEGAGNVAWIIDTGIDLDHPDLNVDVNRSKTFVSSGRDSKDPDDNDGHGTHVAGTIAAVNNDIGIIGVAAGASVVLCHFDEMVKI